MDDVHFNDIICIDDFVNDKNEKRNHDSELLDIGKFIDYVKENIDKKFSLETYKNILEKNPVPDEDEVKKLKSCKSKSYLVKKGVKIEIIYDIFTFLKNYYEESKKDLLSELVRIKSEDPKNVKRINSMNQFTNTDIKAEEQFARFQQKMKNNYYRGHASVNYKLLPSIYRGGLLEKESVMYYELLSHNSHEFIDTKKHIDILRKMQHYGMSTRLLDITSNPLVALYFSVSTNNNYDGEFIIFDEEENVKSNFSDSVEILSALSTQKNEEKKKIYDVAVNYKKNLESSTANNEKIIENFNNELPIKNLLHEIRQKVGNFEPIIVPNDLLKSFFVVPLKDNERIIRQDGSFIIVGLADYTDSNFTTIKETVEKFRKKSDNAETIRYIIPASYKNSIRADLSVLGVNERYLFPGLDTAANYIKRQYTW